MAVDDLLSAIEREAARERDAVRDAARAEAAAVVAAAEQRRGEGIRAALDAHAAERRRRAELELAAAARRATGAVLAARAAMLTRLRAATEAALPRSRDAALEPLVGSALAAIGDAPATVRCAPELVARVEALIGGRAGLRVEADAAAGAGVYAVLDGGRVEVDATLEALLARWWPHLCVEAVREAR